MEAYTAEDLGWARHSSPRLYPPSSIPWQGPDDVATKRLVGVFGNTGCIGPPYKVFGRLEGIAASMEIVLIYTFPLK